MHGPNWSAATFHPLSLTRFLRAKAKPSPRSPTAPARSSDPARATTRWSTRGRPCSRRLRGSPRCLPGPAPATTASDRRSGARRGTRSPPPCGPWAARSSSQAWAAVACALAEARSEEGERGMAPILGCRLPAFSFVCKGCPNPRVRWPMPHKLRWGHPTSTTRPGPANTHRPRVRWLPPGCGL